MKNYAYPKIKGVDPSCYIDAYNLILECGEAHTPRNFSLRLLEQLKKFCSYDKAVILFLDVNGKLSDTYTIGISKKKLYTFFDYYMDHLDIVPFKLNIYDGLSETSGSNFSTQIDWRTVPDSEFKREYIDTLKLKYSWSFCFFDLFGAYRVIISLDRTHNEPFSELELARLGLALPVLNNMHRNFFYQGTDSDEKVVQTPWDAYNLTAREEEITGLLCQGMTTQNISSALFISVTTAYKHIAHIFKKVGVSSQQELIAKLMNRKIL